VLYVEPYPRCHNAYDGAGHFRASSAHFGRAFFSSLKNNQDSFAASNDLRLQQSELTSTWDLMLQTRINLSRSSARMMMDPNNQQSTAKTDLLKNARATLADAAKHYDAFKKIAPQPAMEQVSSNIDEKYTAYFAGLTELIQFLESGNMDAYFAQPTQGCKTPSAQRWVNTPKPVTTCITPPLPKVRTTTASPNGRWLFWRWRW
jgi:hypothetical protein